jgi:proteic killer suppression protein
MIRSFRSKALRALWEKSDTSKIAPQLRARIQRRLDALDAALMPADMNIPGFDFHSLGGDRKGTYTVHVNGPWCITYRWDRVWLAAAKLPKRGRDGQDAIDVDLENYH